MERVLSADERIRRAEEIYLRRLENGSSRVTKVSVDNKKKNVYLRKMCLQCVMCVIIYMAFYSIKNKDDILPQTIVNKINEILQYDINIETWKDEVDKYIIEVNEKEPESFENINEEPASDENISDMEENNVAEVPPQESETQEETTQEVTPASPMEVNAEYVKANYAIMKPLEGQITSRFGYRETVNPKNHTGIDIAEDMGTAIYAAMDGTVEYVSSEGNYGKHLEIKNGEVSTLYAHCSSIHVNQGDVIKQGELIAEVGQTGNATGPHLHFEIMRNGELIDPDLILQF